MYFVDVAMYKYVICYMVRYKVDILQTEEMYVLAEVNTTQELDRGYMITRQLIL